jgi:hypothetical protein
MVQYLHFRILKFPLNLLYIVLAYVKVGDSVHLGEVATVVDQYLGDWDQIQNRRLLW